MDAAHVSIGELYEHYLAHPQVTTDSRKVPPLGLFWSLRGDRFDGNQFAEGALNDGAAYAVVDDPEVARRIGKRALLVEDGLAALQALAKHHRRQLKMPVLAITGSNGKTTTKELIAAVMGRRYRIHFTQGNYNNHIGVPLTLLQIGPDVEMAIVEMGANHQREIAALCEIAEPTHGLITNIGSAHLEGFGGPEGVRKGKGELYDYLAAHRGIAFVNLDADPLPEMAEKLEWRINYMSSDTPSAEEPAMETKLLSASPNVRIAFLGAEGRMVVANTHLPGRHNFENIKAAVAVGKYFKVAPGDIAAALEGYEPENNRSQRSTHRGVDFFLDAYNANPSSVRASLTAFVEAYSPPRAAVLGSMLELGDLSDAAHGEIADLALSLNLERVVLVGPEYASVARERQLPWFAEVTAAKEWFWEQDWPNYTVLLKGSRGVKLEELLQ